jgi:hypothetical protein
MQKEATVSSRSLSGHAGTVKRPTRIITYAWGERYVDILLTFTLPALLAPGNLPYVASQVPCTLVILTERRFFSRFNRHSVMRRIKGICSVRLVRLDDLIVAKDKYGMTLTYALHRAFSDLGPRMTEHWQIFLNADFILADGSLHTLFGHLARGQRIIASPSYCTIAEAVIPDLRKYLNPTTSTLSISHRDLAHLILQHRHTVVQGKTVNQSAFHMRYADQFYWAVDDSTLLGYQMPVSIVGLWPERYVDEPNSYWDYGLIWEYCPEADVCVIGDSDEFTMLELRDRSVAEDQIIPGPSGKKELAERMISWVTPYQKHFIKFRLTLHDRDLPATIDDERSKLDSVLNELMLHVPILPSHVKHAQWEYHWAAFQDARRIANRIRAWIQKKIEPTKLAASMISGLPIVVRGKLFTTVRYFRGKLFATVRYFRGKLFATVRYFALIVESRVVRPLLQAVGRDIIQIANLVALHNELHTNIETHKHEISKLSDIISERQSVITEYQQRLERSYDYQIIMAQDQIRVGMSTLEPEFLRLYQECRQYTMTSWERLYALYKSVKYIVENKIPGDIVECGVWRGGGIKLAAHVLLALGHRDRTLFLYDTFEGMTEPDSEVDIDTSGNNAINDWREVRRKGVKWSYASMDEVREVIASSGYPMDNVVFVKGPVEATLPATIPDRISLLRLDTDWYSSTKHEIQHLYPRLSVNGVLILDDYGHYQGARRAVDEYFERVGNRPMLTRIDYSCRLALKSEVQRSNMLL